MTETDAPSSRASAMGTSLRLSAHIFSVSAGLVGVCLTVMGLFRVVRHTEHLDVVANKLVAVDALVFLITCFVAYLALRARRQERRERLERVADLTFLVGLGVMVLAGSLLAY
jgi:hypothetical protein